MRTIAYTRPGLALLDVPELQLKTPTDVKIKVAYCGICGSDVHFANGSMDALFAHVQNKPLRYRLGHEATGIVTELGSETGIKGLQIGDRVTYYYKKYCGTCYHCRNGQEQFCEHSKDKLMAMSDYLVVDEQQVNKLPDDVTLEQGCFAEPISVCMHAVDLANVKTGSRVVISGGGATGLLCTRLAVLSGAAEITVIEPVEAKRDLARRLGADHAIDPTGEDVLAAARALTDGLGYDAVIETSGVPATCQTAFDMLGCGGTLVYFAVYGTEYAYPVNMWAGFEKGATIRFVHQSPYVWPRVMALLPKMMLDKMTYKIFDPQDVEQAFAAQKSGEYAKILFRFC